MSTNLIPLRRPYRAGVTHCVGTYATGGSAAARYVDHENGFMYVIVRSKMSSVGAGSSLIDRTRLKFADAARELDAVVGGAVRSSLFAS